MSTNNAESTTLMIDYFNSLDQKETTYVSFNQENCSVDSESRTCTTEFDGTSNLIIQCIEMSCTIRAAVLFCYSETAFTSTFSGEVNITNDIDQGDICDYDQVHVLLYS